MLVIVRIFACALVAGILFAVLAAMLFWGPNRDVVLIVLFFACVGAVVGVIGGGAGEVVFALRRKGQG